MVLLGPCRASHGGDDNHSALLGLLGVDLRRFLGLCVSWLPGLMDQSFGASRKALL